MLKHGPVDVIVLAAGEPRFDGSILAELERQVSAGTIRVLDALLLFKDDEGRRAVLNLEDLTPEIKAGLGFIETGTKGLFDTEDADIFYEGMVPGSAVMALAIEHAWAVSLVNAIEANGANLAMQFRVPAQIIDEAFASAAANS